MDRFFVSYELFWQIPLISLWFSFLYKLEERNIVTLLELFRSFNTAVNIGTASFHAVTN